MYIAQNGGAIHIAPLPGHVGSVIASNLGAPPGTVPFNPFLGPYPPFGPGIAVDIAPPIPPPVPPPVPPPIPPPPALPVVRPISFARTW